MRGNPEEGKRAGGKETVDETPDREEDRGEKNFRTRFDSDTEATITGHKNGVIMQVRNIFTTILYEPCRIHILDLVLKYEFSYYFPHFKISRNL